MRHGRAAEPRPLRIDPEAEDRFAPAAWFSDAAEPAAEPRDVAFDREAGSARRQGGGAAAGRAGYAVARAPVFITGCDALILGSTGFRNAVGVGLLSRAVLTGSRHSKWGLVFDYVALAGHTPNRQGAKVRGLILAGKNRLGAVLSGHRHAFIYQWMRMVTLG